MIITIDDCRNMRTDWIVALAAHVEGCRQKEWNAAFALSHAFDPVKQESLLTSKSKFWCKMVTEQKLMSYKYHQNMC